MTLLRKEDYAVGWICALPFPEWKASRLLLDEVHEDLSLGPGVKNQYVYGSMNGHNIVMGCLPSSQMGKGAAASVASEMGAIFPFLRFGLLVGVGGGVPSATNDIRLGDVVVSQPDQANHHGGVIQYDYGKTVQKSTSLQDTGVLNQPPYVLLSALSKVQSAPRASSKFAEYLDSLEHNSENAEFGIPERSDRLFEASYVHPDDAFSCDSCSAEHEIKRAPRRDNIPIPHFGTIASGDQVMKSALMRDTLSKKHSGIMCFEMEAAGLMNQFPCLVIKGICDYCDSHKNKAWQPFAAATAAAWAKELLRNVASGVRFVDGISSDPLSIQRDLVRTKKDEYEPKAVGDPKRRGAQVKAYLGPSMDPQDTFERTNKQRAPETCEWIRYDPNFTSWLSRAFPVLLVSGTPGAGKTFLSVSMASYLRQLFTRGESPTGAQASVGYYFFKDNNSGTRGLAQALRDIAFQICQSDVTYEMHIEDLSNSERDVGTLENAWKHLFRDFWIREESQGADVQNAAYIILDGIDEAFQTQMKDFLDHLQDLNFDASRPSRLQIVLVGRTHLTDDVSDALPLGQFHDIRVDLDKTAADIRTYVKGSMRKSRLLRKVSRKLQDEVLTILSTQSNGMFLWVDLMLRELNTRRSEREVSEALHKAPKGIFAILTHVLDGLSETLQKEDVEDFNNLVAFVASAPAPVTLSVLDALLKYKSPTGDSVLLLESHLRRQYASFFNVLRIDGLTTAELQRSKNRNFDFQLESDNDDDDNHGDKLNAEGLDFEDGIGMDDLDADFDSDLESTYVVFTHASIGDFFRREGGAEVAASTGFSVGIEIESARFETLKTIFEVLMDKEINETPSDPQDDEAAERSKGPLALKRYARTNFLAHMPTVDPCKVSSEEKRILVPMLVKFLSTKEGFEDWVKEVDVPESLWSDESLNMLRKWIGDTDARDALNVEEREWVDNTAENPVTVLSSIAMFHAERWLQDSTSNPMHNFSFISEYRRVLEEQKVSSKESSMTDVEGQSLDWDDVKMVSIGKEEEKAQQNDVTEDNYQEKEQYGQDGAKDDEDELSVDFILDQAEWAGFEKSALWNKRVAMVVRDSGFPNESKTYFERAIELDTDMLEARGGLAKAYMLQEQHTTGLAVLEESISLLKDKSARETAAEGNSTAHWLALDLISLGKCYEALDRAKEARDAFEEAWRINPMDTASAFEYVRLSDARNELQECVAFLREMDSRTVEEGDCSYLTQLLATQGLSFMGQFLGIMCRACLSVDEVPFVHAILRHAVAHSVKHKMLDHAMTLRLMLGCFYVWMQETEERGMAILEPYIDLKISSDLFPVIANMHGRSMTILASVYFHRAWRLYGTPECRPYLEKLGNLAVRGRTSMSGEYDSTPSVVLGSWLRSHGQPGEATALFRPQIVRILREIDTNTPAEAAPQLLALADILILAGNEENTAAIVRTLLRAEGVTREQIDEDFQVCDGVCSCHPNIWLEQVMFQCRHCLSTHFCKPCLDQLQAGTGPKILMNSCNPQHDWLRIDLRDETVPEGKMLVGASDEVVDFGKWKDKIKREWGI